MGIMAASDAHINLANTVKKVHQDLRNLARTLGPDEAWKCHVQNNNVVLKEYAQAMKTLATEHWDINNKSDSSLCRLQWVVDKINEYFFNDLLLKEFARESALLVKHDIPCPPDVGQPFKPEKVRLLDIGSCYNPFQRFENLEVVAIDLEPAVADVIQCDFLSAEIDTVEKINRGVFAEESFHVAVLSFVLEYLPSPEQRYLMVSKAALILRPGGLLFILTPDSGHPSARSQLMRQWRICLASLGLMRIFYEKLPHLHCLAFRRCWVPKLAINWHLRNVPDGVKPETMLNIPQDSKLIEQPEERSCLNQASFSPDDLQATFTELPLSFD